MIVKIKENMKIFIKNKKVSEFINQKNKKQN